MIKILIKIQVFRYIIRRMSEGSSWRGVPLCDIYGSQSPWGAPEFPLIHPSYNHAVLFNISNEAKDRPPTPKTGQDQWDSDFVRMPCSNKSLYPVIGVNAIV